MITELENFAEQPLYNNITPLVVALRQRRFGFFPPVTVEMENVEVREGDEAIVGLHVTIVQGDKRREIGILGEKVTSGPNYTLANEIGRSRCDATFMMVNLAGVVNQRFARFKLISWWEPQTAPQEKTA